MIVFADLCGVCSEYAEIMHFTKSSGQELKKREFTIVDTSNASVNVTLWVRRWRSSMVNINPSF
jgi:Replication protein A OB domain